MKKNSQLVAAMHLSLVLFENLCTSYKKYDPSDPNDFTGPMPRAPSGIFTLGPDGPGFSIETDITGSDTLRRNGDPYATMDTTWQETSITGVFIRLRWNTVHKGYNRFERI